MRTNGRPVDAQHSCAAFEHGWWSLDEEPAVCENCVHYDEGMCYLDKSDEEK